MTKAERLFQLYTLLRARRTAITGEAIAQVMEVSVRTVYRDVQALQLSGIQIDGEPGIGYLLRAGNELPPLMFDADEVLALMVGARMVRAFTDPQLAQAAAQAERKIASILPQGLKQRAAKQPYRIPLLRRDDVLREKHALLRQACEAQCKIRITYLDEEQKQSQRVLWPLGIIGWSGRWTLLAWCELRQNYRNFRFDRVQATELLDEGFDTDAQMCLQHYLHSVPGGYVQEMDLD